MHGRPRSFRESIVCAVRIPNGNCTITETRESGSLARKPPHGIGRQTHGTSLAPRLATRMNPPPAPPAKLPDRLLFWSAALFIGLLQTWAHRHDIVPDGISYIELGWAAARSGLTHLVSGYWSPLYPFLLSLEFRIVSPSPPFEFAAVHLLNFLLFIGTIACFELFLKELILARRASSALPAESVATSERTLW